MHWNLLIWLGFTAAMIMATLLLGRLLAGPEELEHPDPRVAADINRRLRRQGLRPKHLWRHGD